MMRQGCRLPPLGAQVAARKEGEGDLEESGAAATEDRVRFLVRLGGVLDAAEAVRNPNLEGRILALVKGAAPDRRLGRERMREEEDHQRKGREQGR